MAISTRRLSNGFIETVANVLYKKHKIISLKDKMVVDNKVVIKQAPQPKIRYSTIESKRNTFLAKKWQRAKEKMAEKSYDAQRRTNELLLGILAKQKESAERRESGKKGKGFFSKLMGGGKAVKALSTLGSKLGLGLVKNIGKVLFGALSPKKFIALGALAVGYMSDGFKESQKEFSDYKERMGLASHGLLSDIVGYSSSLISDMSKWLSDATNGAIPSIPKSVTMEYAQKIEDALIKSYEVGAKLLEMGYSSIKDTIGLDDKKINEINKKIEEWISEKWDTLLSFTGFNKEGIENKNRAIQDKLEEWRDKVNTTLTDYMNDVTDWVEDKVSSAKKAMSDTKERVANSAKKKYESVKKTVADISHGRVFGDSGTTVDEAKKARDAIRKLSDDLYIVTSDNPVHKVQSMFKKSQAELEKQLLDASTKYNQMLLNRDKASRDYLNINKNKINKVTNKKGGSISWRNNNSGNLKYEYADAVGMPKKHSMRSYEKALAKAQSLNSGVVALDRYGYAVFATKEDGDNAKRNLVTRTRGNRTISSMLGTYSISDYTGKANNKRYEKVILNEAKKAGVTLDSKTKIKDFSREQQDALLKGMEKHEGYKIGSVIDPLLNKNLSDLIAVLGSSEKVNDKKDSGGNIGNTVEFVDDVGNQGRV